MRSRKKDLNWYREEMILTGNNAIRLAELMTMMEEQFNIPMLRSKEWEATNSEVATLYKQMSNRRDME